MSQTTVREIPISDISPANSKIVARFETEQPESEELSELVNSIKRMGVIEPIILRPKGAKGYEVVAGNRRLKCAKIAKLDTIPSIVKDLDDTQALILAFVENVLRKEVNAMQKAKGLAAMYKSVGISKEIAIQKVHKVMNEEAKGSFSSLRTNRITESGNAIKKGAEITPKFLDVFKEIPLSANRQYVLLKLVTQLTEPIQEIVEETNLSANKASMLTHSGLKKYPKAQEYVADMIKDRKITNNRAKQIVNQAATDLESGYLTEKEFGLSVGMGRDEVVSGDPDIDKTFDVQIPDFRALLLKTIGKLIDRPITRGEIFYEIKVIQPWLDKFEKNLQTVKKKDRQWLAIDAAILMKICKIIVDSAK